MTNSLPTQVDYTSRDYTSIRSDMIARIKERVPDWSGEDESDFGLAIVEAFAYMGDLMSYYIDRVANESTLSTATRRASVLALANDLGYTPSGYGPSTMTMKIQNTSEDTSYTIPAGTVASASIEVGDALLTIPFTTNAEVTVAAGSVGSVSATQGEFVTGPDGYGESVGVSDGTPSQVFSINYPSIAVESVQVYVYDGVNYSPWTRVDYLTDYSPLTRVFRVVENADGNYDIEFGDGVSGLVPTQSHVVYVTYRKVDGADGNIPALSSQYWDLTTVPGLTSGQVAVLSGNISVYNDTPATGGTNPESTDSIRTNAPQFFRAANRAVTLDDYQNLALGVNNCGKASAYAANPASVLMVVAPYRSIGLAEEYPGFDSYTDATNTGTATNELSTLKSAVDSAVTSAMLAGTTLTVLNPKHVHFILTITTSVVEGVRQADAETLIRQFILSSFDYAGANFGAEVYESDVIAAVARLGVSKTITVDALHKRTDGSGAGTIVANWDELLLISESDLTVNFV